MTVINREEANADNAPVLLQAQAATSQRPNHTRQGVCRTQAENVFAVCLTEAASSRITQRDRSESELQGAAVRLIKVYLLTCAHLEGRSSGSFRRKTQGLCDADIVEGRTKRSVVLIEHNDVCGSLMRRLRNSTALQEMQSENETRAKVDRSRETDRRILLKVAGVLRQGVRLLQGVLRNSNNV